MGRSGGGWWVAMVDEEMGVLVGVLVREERGKGWGGGWGMGV